MRTAILKALLIVVCTLFFLYTKEVHAQLLLKSSKMIFAKKSISYTDIVQMKFSFDENFSSDTLKSDILADTVQSISSGKFHLKGKKVSYAFDGNKLVTLNYLDSTYNVQKESVSAQDTRTLIYWAEKMRQLSLMPRNKAAQVRDTVINSISFTNVYVIESDTIENKERAYSVINFVIDKNTNLPIMIINRIKGNANDGTSFGLTEIHNYSEYRFDKANFPDLSMAVIPNYFKLPVKRKPVKFLENGNVAPALEAFDLSGRKIELEKLRGKMILINFSLIGCPHCVGAAQMLNRLNERYKNNNLVILNVYPIDGAEVIAKFDQKENVKTPSYTSDKTVQQTYPFDGYPSFYLINKRGKIEQSYNGYYRELEAQIIETIDSLL